MKSVSKPPEIEVAQDSGFAAEWSFRTWVAEGGYHWVRYPELGPGRGQPKIAMKDDWVLTERDTSASRRYREVHPLRDCPTFFREFADLPFGDRDAVLEFAGQYGMLGQETGLNQTVEGISPTGQYPRNEVRGHRIPCDRMSDWMESPVKIRVLYRLWKCVQGNKTDDLRHLLKLEKPAEGLCWVCRPDPVIDDAPDWLTWIVYPDPTNGRSILLWNGMEDLRDVARVFLANQVSDGATLGGWYAVRFNLTPTCGQVGFTIRPTSLLNAAFVQLGRAISGNKEQRRCKICEKWFELVPQDKGRKEFCSDVCKSQDYRDRKKKALELKATGRTPKQIAEETGTDMATVKRWVDNKGVTKRKGK